MLKSNRILLPLITLVLLLGAAFLLYTRLSSKAQIDHRQLADGSQITLVTPSDISKARVLLATEAGTQLPDNDLLALAQESGAQLVEFNLTSDDCTAQLQRAQAAIEQLSGQPTLVVGIGKGAAFAWRWLATQNDDNAQALSVGFSLQQQDCTAPLPEQAEHGRWFAAWNNNPDDSTALFARTQSNAQTSISDYNIALPELLKIRLSELLNDQNEAMPTIEIGNKQVDTVTLFYSGDGGWRDLDKAVAEEMAARNYPVVGIDSLRYFWQHKSPEHAATDLSRLMQHYRDNWGSKRFVLAGFSFGADVLPALYNHLPQTDQQQIDAILLMGLARSASFQVEVKGWLGQDGQEAQTGPELSKLPTNKVLCIYGKDEQASSGCTESTAVGEKVQLPGGHHFDKNYPALTERLLRAIQQRQLQ